MHKEAKARSQSWKQRLLAEDDKLKSGCPGGEQDDYGI
jgi:hypothetical protein